MITTEYKYQLDKSSKKFPCPSCGKKRFVRYVDTERKEYFPENYGRCDRESKCGYHLTPYADGYGKEQFIPQRRASKKPKRKDIPFDFQAFKETLQGYEKNIFIQNLLNKFPTDVIEKMISLYRIGTITDGYMTGATTFPFIDIRGQIRAIQVKQFDKENHTTKTSFLHAILKYRYKDVPKWLEEYQKNDKKISCLFGEHLLTNDKTPVALVEAPKTALYCWLYFKDYEPLKNITWLAIYNKSSFSYDKLKVLQGRYIYVFPDLSIDGSTYNEWKEKAKRYSINGTKFVFSDLLENLAREEDKKQGNDIADVLIKLDWENFQKNKMCLNANFSTETNYLPKWIVDSKWILQQYEAGNLSDNEYLDKLQANFEDSGLFGQDYVNKVNGYDWQTELNNIIHDYKSGAINEPAFYQRIVQNADKSGLSDAEYEKVLNSYYL